MSAWEQYANEILNILVATAPNVKFSNAPISPQTMFIIRLQDLSATIWCLHVNTNQYVQGIYCSDTTQKRFMRCKTSN